MPHIAVALLCCLAQTPDSLPPWVSVDEAARTVSLELTVTRPSGAPSAQINGISNGSLQLVVPRGWTVKWRWQNNDSTSVHSVVVMAEREKLPQEGARPAFSNAMSRSLVTGLPVGSTDVTPFEADEAGWYWVLCGVPNHAIAGEYFGLRVDPEAKGVSVKRK